MTDITASMELRRQNRWDIYGPIHKGLRLLWADLTRRLGALDLDDAAATAAMMKDLRRGLDLGGKHLGHEEKYMHPELNARAAKASASIDRQHEEHRQRFAELDTLIAAVESTPDADTRHLRGRTLYLVFSAFVAEDLEHMHEEETVIWPKLCGAFTDHELETIENTILASVSPEDIMDFLKIMIPAMNRRERAALLGSMKAAAPPEAFAAVIEHAARPTLSTEDMADLSQRLKLAA